MAGGVTSMVCMPNTEPVIDDVALVDYIKRHATDPGYIHIYPMAAVTKGLRGKEMTEIGLLKQAGAIAFTNGKDSIPNAKMMRMVLSYAKDFDALIVHFTEDNDLADPGVMNEGLGLQLAWDCRGVPLRPKSSHLSAISGSLN